MAQLSVGGFVSKSVEAGAAYLSPEERRALGRGRRSQLRRSGLAHWSARHRTLSALDVLRRSERGRLQHLLAIKHQRMMASPFGYFRGAAPVMAADMAQIPNSGVITQICGDAHVLNLGAFESPDGRLVFDINDFDETLHAPFEWDIRRMAASLVLAGRATGQKESASTRAVTRMVRSYAATVASMAVTPVLDAAKLHVHGLRRAEPVSTALLDAERATPIHNLERLTRPVSGGRIFIAEPPLRERIRGAKAQRVLDSLAAYRQSLLPERRHFFDQYRPVDVEFRLVGTGSVGTRCYVVYLEGNGPADPLFLQIKEEDASAWSPYAPLHGATAAHQGQRVADGQRAMQVQSDPMLGWTGIGAHDYLVRQLNDHKGSISVESLAGEGLAEYADVCGQLLARGHCRSGDACVLAGYVGNGNKVADAMSHFAKRYADQTERDWEAMKKAFAEGEPSRCCDMQP